MRFVRFVFVAPLLAFATGARAQQSSSVRLTEVPVPVPAPGSFVVKTVPLHHLTGIEAMKLLSPYVQTPGGGVFEVSMNIRAVTIRESPKVYADMMAVLAQYDRDPATVTLNFQLVSAENSGSRDPAVAGLDSLLRGVLKFSGYRLLSTSVASASEGGRVSQSLSGENEPLLLTVTVEDLRVDGSNASVHLDVSLWKSAVGGVQSAALPRLLSTGVTVPIGQTVVLGTTATDNGQRALILTVRPQLSQAKK